MLFIATPVKQTDLDSTGRWMGAGHFDVGTLEIVTIENLIKEYQIGKVFELLSQPEPL